MSQRTLCWCSLNSRGLTHATRWFPLRRRRCCLVSPPLRSSWQSLHTDSRGIAGSISNTTEPISDARMKWYQRQLSLGHMSVHDVPMVLSTLIAKGQGWSLLCAALLTDATTHGSSSLLQCAARLSPPQKLRSLVVLVDGAPRSHAHSLRAMFDVLTDSCISSAITRLSTGKSAVDDVVHLFESVTRQKEAESLTAMLNEQHVGQLVRQVLMLPPEVLSTCHPDAADRLDRCAIRAAEHYLDDASLSALYQECHMPFEAAAYHIQMGNLEEPRRTQSGKGFGDDVCAALSIKQSDATRRAFIVSRMPERLARYTNELFTLSSARRSREAAEVFLPITSAPRVCHDAEIEGQSELKRTSDIHFRYLCGTEATAKRLLPHCTTRRQLTTVMAYTSNAGLPTACDAAASLLLARPSDPLYVSLRLAGGSQPGRRRRVASRRSHPVFAFEVKAKPISVSDSAARSSNASTSRDEAEWTSTSSDRFAADTLWRALSATDLLKFHSSFGSSTRSSEEALTYLAEDRIAGLLASVPHLRASQISLWGSLLIQRGKLSAAQALFESAAQRHLAPDMQTIVDFLEAHHRSEPGSVQGAAQFVKLHFPVVAPNAFRAFMERLCTRQLSASGGQLAPITALQLLLYSVDNELHHAPPQCVDVVANGQQGDDIRALLDVLSASRTSAASSKVNSSAKPSSRVPTLCIDAVRRLCLTTDELRWAPCVDFFSVSSATRDVLWWSSRDAAMSKSATTRLYQTGACALWSVATRELEWGTLDKPTAAIKALRLTALGCADPLHIASTLESGLDWIASDRCVPARRSRAHQEAALLTPTLICACEALCAMGERALALKLMPVATESAPAALRDARLRLSSSDCGGAANSSPPATELAPVGHLHHHQSRGRRPRMRSNNSLRRRRMTRSAGRQSATLSVPGFPRPLQRLVNSSVYAGKISG